MWWQDLNPGIYIAIILSLIIIILLIESIKHRTQLRKIPIRIHVNGTRGKSSVTRLIAAGLRAGGLVTSAKTTGTLTRFILPDGSEETIYRIGHTNIAEQIKIVKKAADLNCKALVIECMSLHPLLQSVCELKLIKSTHGVLTNVRPDHLDIMGPLESDVALALAGTVPVNGKFFTPEQKHINIFKKALTDRRSELIHVNQQDISTISNEEIRKFSYEEHKENVALALAVCNALGVDRQTALQGMWEATPDPGAMCIYQIQYNEHWIIFANGFAANDPVSSEMLWDNLLLHITDYEDLTLIINCRADRQDRSKQLGEAISNWKTADQIIAIGSGTKTFLYQLNRSRWPNVIDGEAWTVEQILQAITHNAQHKKHFVFGIGNIADIGLKFIDYFQKNQEK